MGLNVRRHAIVARDLPLRVDIDFAEDDLAWFALCARELLEDGRDDLARPAPVGVEVDDCVGCGGGEGAEVRGGRNGCDFGRHCVLPRREVARIVVMLFDLVVCSKRTAKG